MHSDLEPFLHVFMNLYMLCKLLYDAVTWASMRFLSLPTWLFVHGLIGLTTKIQSALCITGHLFGKFTLQGVHYSDVIMNATPSHITGVSSVCWAVYSGVGQRKHQSSASLAFVRDKLLVTGGFPTQMANNAENVSIWWRHYVMALVLAQNKDD